MVVGDLKLFKGPFDWLCNESNVVKFTLDAYELVNEFKVEAQLHF